METVNLCILDGMLLYSWPDPDPRYRGVHRHDPNYCEALPADHEINRIFVDWYVEEAGDGGIVHELDKAVHYAELCNKHFPGQFFEIVELTEADASPNIGGRFLGFDLSNGYATSILQGGHQSWTSHYDPASPADVLWKVMRLYFGPRLSEFGLFQKLEDASLCIEAMAALQSYKPGYFEGCDLDEYRPMGIYLVWGQDNWPPVAGGVAHWQEGANPHGS